MILDEIKQKITIVQPKRVTNPTENTESVKGKVLYSIGGAYEKKVPPTKF